MMIEISIALVLFLPIIAKCFSKNKWYLYLFFAFYGILPDTFAIEISSSLPLLTGTRVLILILLFFWLVKSGGRIRTTKNMHSFLVYIAISCAVCIVNLFSDLGEINKLFILIVQRLLPVIMVKDLIDSDDEFDKCIDFMLMSSIAVAIIGILQTVVRIDASLAFQLVAERVDSSLSDRMGLMRAKGLFNAIQYGSYCAFVILLAIYKFIETRKNKYLFVGCINAVALLMTMSRSSIIPLVVLLIPILYKKRKALFKPIFYGIPAVFVLCIALYIAKPGVFDVVSNVWFSILKTLGLSVEISEAFGNNANGSMSRLMQFSLILYMFQNGGWLFGLGYNGLVRGLYHFYFPMYHAWSVAYFLDVGFVGEFGASGIIGLLALLFFVISVYQLSKKNRYKSKKEFYFLMQYAIVLYMLLNIMTACISMNVFWMLIMLLYARLKIDRRQITT